MSSTANTQPPACFLLDGTPFRSAPLPRNFQRSQYLLTTTIINLFCHYLIEHVLFITLTFPDDVRSTAEAHRRLNSLMNKVRPRCLGYLYILQPQASGRIHYHLLVPVSFDAHDGTNLDAWENRTMYTDKQRRQAMNPALRAEADWWENKAAAYGFGRVEVAPIYSNAEAVRKYMTKQDWRRRHWPFEETKNVRFWSCSRGLRVGTVKFSWETPNGRLRRERLRAWAQLRGCYSLDDVRRSLGRNWAWSFFYDLQGAEWSRQIIITSVEQSTDPDVGSPLSMRALARSMSYLYFISTVFPDDTAFQDAVRRILELQ